MWPFSLSLVGLKQQEAPLLRSHFPFLNFVPSYSPLGFLSPMKAYFALLNSRLIYRYNVLISSLLIKNRPAPGRLFPYTFEILDLDNDARSLFPIACAADDLELVFTHDNSNDYSYLIHNQVAGYELNNRGVSSNCTQTVDYSFGATSKPEFNGVDYYGMGAMNGYLLSQSLYYSQNEQPERAQFTESNTPYAFLTLPPVPELQSQFAANEVRGYSRYQQSFETQELELSMNEEFGGLDDEFMLSQRKVSFHEPAVNRHGHITEALLKDEEDLSQILPPPLVSHYHHFHGEKERAEGLNSVESVIGGFFDSDSCGAANTGMRSFDQRPARKSYSGNSIASQGSQSRHHSCIEESASFRSSPTASISSTSASSVSEPCFKKRSYSNIEEQPSFDSLTTSFSVAVIKRAKPAKAPEVGLFSVKMEDSPEPISLLESQKPPTLMSTSCKPSFRLTQPQAEVIRPKQEEPEYSTIPTGTDIYNCLICEASFKVKGYLTRHLKKHSSAKAFVCPFFNDPEDTKETLEADVSKSGSGTKCHPTGGFSRKDTYKTHLKALHFIYPPGTKSNNRSEVGGRCAGCFEFFGNNNVWLEKHMEKQQCPGVVIGCTDMDEVD
ncbi:hypothetical protein BABINDRAFT_159725 [Babjeviella inositovora NRRL Y-12698]|uniref:C2H2-type domain-containing protein n=1 Tax=Babjeviella inositovora NRRL Y-12698 TaxID=984486 RepID=A0A1E3QUS8_9ASCO|nr:uncharacterized protein BABINDRAFT_159725 [Babjeviella inositovora NRRL Y-12698]ODQ81431.1 hypothetical protein BABINDRAFT_159725 [Babjeviella inositovora NRRL Y-12698]